MILILVQFRIDEIILVNLFDYLGCLMINDLFSLDFHQIQLKTTSQKQINPFAIQLMKPKDNKTQAHREKDNKSFMNKFKDKHSIISKQGLLKLFENQRMRQQSKQQKKSLQKESQPINLRMVEKNIEKKKIEEIIKSRSQRKGSDVSITKSVQLPQIKPILPKIQKSISTTVHLRQKMMTSPITKAQTDSIPKKMKKIASSDIKKKSHVDSFNFELDKFALDHLDFLDKFQQRIRKRELTPF